MKKPTIEKKNWHVALLRGINVGGNNIVSMKQLKETFEQLGFADVKTYINSGNIVFTTPAENDATLVGKIEKAILKQYGFEVRVVVKSRAEVATVVKKIPPQWVTDKDMRTEVMFLWSDVDKPGILKGIAAAPAVDNLLYAKGAVIWNFDRANYSKSKIGKLIGTHVYKNMTGRNANTTRKLLEMMGE